MTIRAFPLLAAAVALIAGAPPVQVSAQNAATELVRKAQARERDGGFCASANLEKIAFEEMPARASRILTQSDVAARVTWAVVKEGELICFHVVFAAAAPRQGKKCRATETYVCKANAACFRLDNDFICEVSPGQWD